MGSKIKPLSHGQQTTRQGLTIRQQAYYELHLNFKDDVIFQTIFHDFVIFFDVARLITVFSMIFTIHLAAKCNKDSDRIQRLTWKKQRKTIIDTNEFEKYVFEFFSGKLMKVNQMYGLIVRYIFLSLQNYTIKSVFKKQKWAFKINNKLVLLNFVEFIFVNHIFILIKFYQQITPLMFHIFGHFKCENTRTVVQLGHCYFQQISF